MKKIVSTLLLFGLTSSSFAQEFKFNQRAQANFLPFTNVLAQPAQRGLLGADELGAHPSKPIALQDKGNVGVTYINSLLMTKGQSAQVLKSDYLEVAITPKNKDDGKELKSFSFKVLHGEGIRLFSFFSVVANKNKEGKWTFKDFGGDPHPNQKVLMVKTSPVDQTHSLLIPASVIKNFNKKYIQFAKVNTGKYVGHVNDANTKNIPVTVGLRATPFTKSVVAKMPDIKVLNSHIEKLGSGKFQTRELATQNLLKILVPVIKKSDPDEGPMTKISQIFKAGYLKSGKDPEVKLRLNFIYSKLDKAAHYRDPNFKLPSFVK